MCKGKMEPGEMEKARAEQEEFKAMSCAELLLYLRDHWETMWEWDRVYLTSLLVQKGCQKGVPYLVEQLRSADPSSRWQALAGLKDLRCREHRQLFVDLLLTDPDEDVRRHALTGLSALFRGEHDIAILRLAIEAYDDQSSSVAMRLAAGAAMMYQFDVPKDLGWPSWWNEEEEDLQHPALQWAVAQARQLLARGQSRL